jgi:hypothetical protein
MTLPLYPSMSHDQIDLVVNELTTAVASWRDAREAFNAPPHNGGQSCGHPA